MKKRIVLLCSIMVLTGCSLGKAIEEKLAKANDTVVTSKNGIIEVRITEETENEKTVIAKQIQYDNENKIRKITTTDTTPGNVEKIISYADVSTDKVINYVSIQNNWYTVEGEVASYLSPKSINHLLDPLSSFEYVKEGNKEGNLKWHQLNINKEKMYGLIFDTFQIETEENKPDTIPVEVLFDEKNKMISKIEFDCKEALETESCKAEIIYDKIDIAGKINLDESIVNNKNQTYQGEEGFFSIFSLIEKNQDQAHTFSAQGLLDAIRLEYTWQLLEDNARTKIEYNFTLQNEDAKNLRVTGKKPMDGVIIIENGEFTKVENIRFEGMKNACTYKYDTREISC